MIPRETVQKIQEESRVEEVVGEFVNLKKRGANMLGLCPFHDEKTPSFVVSPAKNIYKCFGCGQAGNPTKFMMEHEQMTFPEALRYLAKKYNIEIEEREVTPEEAEKATERESILIALSYAQRTFTENLLSTDEGKSIGGSYFKERGVSEQMIEKFQLGYTLDKGDAFTKQAMDAGYKLEILKKAGLTSPKENSTYDFFRSRVMFPIHNVTGQVLGFGARTLKTDKKIPKYINTGESEVYNKSRVLYAMNFAKAAIRKFDECFIVEGYTDVISLHQAGIENVVASSGTSLTVGQAKLIKRYSPNATLLFDGDAAGIKAALRGVDILLEQELNVRVVQLPEGEDPDSFVRQTGQSGFEEYIAENKKDFILFKADLMLQDAKDDPTKKAELVRDIVDTIVKVNDPIKRSEYVKVCGRLLDVNEQILIAEVNKGRRKKQYDQKKTSASQQQEAEWINDKIDASVHEQQQYEKTGLEAFEKDVIRLLCEYCNEEIEEGISAVDYLLGEIDEDFEHTLYDSIVKEVRAERTEKKDVTEHFFLSHPNEAVTNLVIELVTEPYLISENWYEMHKITVPNKRQFFKKDITSSLTRYKLVKTRQLMDENQQRMKDQPNDERITTWLKIHISLKEKEKEYTEILGTVVLG